MLFLLALLACNPNPPQPVPPPPGEEWVRIPQPPGSPGGTLCWAWKDEPACRWGDGPLPPPPAPKADEAEAEDSAVKSDEAKADEESKAPEAKAEDAKP